jgi:membrane fusion protein, multidrug efflux system
MYWSKKSTKQLFLLFFVAVACKGKPQPVKPKEAPPTVVDVIVASPQSISNIVEANGSVVANEYVELHPEVSGRLIYLNVPEGGHITQGTVIARINDADLQAQLSKSKVQRDYDVAFNQVNGYKADIAYTQTLIDKTVIKAPFSGTAGLRQVSPGAFVTASSIIVTIQQVDKVKIDFTLPEEYSSLIKKGNLVEVELDAGQQTRRKAQVIATEPQVNLATRNLKVRAILQGGSANPGAFVKVYVSSGANKKAIMVPTNAIIPDDKNSQLVLVKSGKAAFVNVKTGAREASNVEITKGVEPGDSVVVTGVLFARPKTPLKVRGVKTLEQLAKQQ